MTTLTDRGMGMGLRALRTAAGYPLLDRLGLRERAEQAAFELSKNGFKAGVAAGRVFTRVPGKGAPVRHGAVAVLEPGALFDPLRPATTAREDGEGWCSSARRRSCRSRRQPSSCSWLHTPRPVRQPSSPSRARRPGSRWRPSPGLGSARRRPGGSGCPA